MAAIDQIIDISISLQTSAVPQAGFGTPLIVGPNGGFSEKVRYYSELSSVLDDYETSDAEYIYASKAFGQSLVPQLVGIGKRTTAVAQVNTVSITTVANAFAYVVTINGLAITYTSDADALGSEIQAGLVAAINGSAQAANVTASNGAGTSVVVTCDVAGQGFTIAVGTNLSVVETTANNGIVDDLQAILDQAINGNNWYGLSITSQTEADIKQTAAFIEGLKKIFVADSADSDIKTTSTTDLLSDLKALGYKRTALMYSPASAAIGPSAAWLGGQLPQVPGASTWMFKNLTGIPADSFTDSERSILIGVPGTPGKNANIYSDVGGQSITQEGWMVGGQYIDVTVGVDWFESTLQTNIFALLVQNPKIPYTDQGGAVIENAVRQTIKQGIANGLIDGGSAISVTVPAVLSVPANTRAARIFTPVKFSFRLAGAFHHIVIQGTVTA